VAVAALAQQDLRRYRMSIGAAFAMAVVSGLVGACEGRTAGDAEAGGRPVPGAGSFATAGQDVLSVDEPEVWAGTGAAAIGVSPDLWHASLETISFMPLASADPLVGMIITDWYEPPETLRERVKVNLYVLAREPRPGGVRAAVFRQRRDPYGPVARANQVLPLPTAHIAS